MPAMCRTKKAEKLFREIMGDPQNASKKFNVKNNKKNKEGAPFNTTYAPSQDFPNEAQ
jgi:hypothetical protein